MAVFEDGRAEGVRQKEDEGEDHGEDGPGVDVKLVVGLRFGAHGREYEGRSEK